MILLRSRLFTTTASVLLAAVALTRAPSAFADVAAPEYCPTTDSIGQSCSTAGPNFDEEGTCQEVACDGGNEPCGLLCELGPDGGPVTPPDAGPVTNPPDAGPVTNPPDAGPVTNSP